MAEERIKDAEALLTGKRWEFAYYSAGYAVECALKSCILSRMIHTGWVFEEKWRADVCRTHDFGELIRLAGLSQELADRLAESAAAAASVGGPSGGAFAGYWGTVLGWKVESRYEAKSEVEAKALYEAITADPDGVLIWLRKFW
jgi:hypothetical protein